MGRGRDWNVDLIPKFLMANGNEAARFNCLTKLHVYVFKCNSPISINYTTALLISRIQLVRRCWSPLYNSSFGNGACCKFRTHIVILMPLFSYVIGFEVTAYTGTRVVDLNLKTPKVFNQKKKCIIVDMMKESPVSGLCNSKFPDREFCTSW